jgi:hypothetical protein
LADLSSGRFENVTASTIILSLKNYPNANNAAIRIVERFSPGSQQSFKELSQDNFLKNISYTFNIFADSSFDAVLSKIETGSSRLDGFGNVSCGIATGPGKKKYIANEKLTAVYKPLIEGKDLKPYRIDFKHKYILYDRKKLFRARDEGVFLSKEKLVTQRIAGGANPLVVAYDDQQFYPFNSTNSIVGRNGSGLSMKYLLAVLNSKLLNWYYVMKFTNRSVLTVNISKTFPEQLPIKKPSVKEETKIVHVVDKILHHTSSGTYPNDTKAQASVRAYQNEVDSLVYQIYGLTSDEIAIVEGTRELEVSVERS